MNKKCILPIVEAPSMNSYVHHSYPLSIVEDKSICSFYLRNRPDRPWDIEASDASVDYSRDSNKLSIKNKKGRTDSTLIIKRLCDTNDEMIIKINDFVLFNSLSYVCLSVGNQEHLTEGEINYFCWNQYNISVKERQIAFDGHFKLYYRMRKVDSYIEISASQDCSSWVPVYEMEAVYDISQDVYFQIKIYYGENHYEYWKNMNYIQMIYNNKDCNTVYLDYFTYPRKRYDASYQEFSYFLDTEYLLLDDCLQTYNGVVSFLKGSIEQKYYVNIDIDEQFIPERQDLEKKEFYHFNLFHGYDDEKKEFYALGYNQSGKLKSVPISYDVVRRDILGNNVVRYKKNINSAKYVFSIDYVLNSLKEYLYGVDSSEKFMGVIGKQQGVYGMNIFNELLNTKRGNELIVNDRRLSFVLYEHCFNMMDRLSFIDRLDYLNKDNKEELFDLGGRMLKTAVILKNRVIKNIYTQNLEDKILAQLSSLYEIEKKFYTELIGSIYNS